MPSHRHKTLIISKRNRFPTSHSHELSCSEGVGESNILLGKTSKNRRATLISIPPTLINISNEDYMNGTLIQPIVFIYNEETYQELSYRSIENIPHVNSNDCLWIDVSGVRQHRSMKDDVLKRISFSILGSRSRPIDSSRSSIRSSSIGRRRY